MLSIHAIIYHYTVICVLWCMYVLLRVIKFKTFCSQLPKHYTSILFSFYPISSSFPFLHLSLSIFSLLSFFFYLFFSFYLFFFYLYSFYLLFFLSFFSLSLFLHLFTLFLLSLLVLINYLIFASNLFII